MLNARRTRADAQRRAHYPTAQDCTRISDRGVFRLVEPRGFASTAARLTGVGIRAPLRSVPENASDDPFLRTPPTATSLSNAPAPLSRPAVPIPEALRI